MMTAGKKIISVVGATGTQGGSVARSLLQNPDFHVRCLTRDPNSASAKELGSLGAELVQVDGSNEEAAATVLAGSWGIFINNGYHNTELIRSGRYELDFGNCLLRAAAVAGVPHVVFSSQPSAEKLSNGQYKTPILDIKAWGEDWGRNCPVFTTFTPIMCSWYMEDFLMPAFYQGFGGFPWETDDEGYRTLRSPLLGGEEHVPWISVRDDFGDLVHGIFLNPLRWHLRTVQAVGEIRSFAGVVDVFQRVTGLPARFVGYADPEQFPAYAKPELQESKDVFSFYRMRDGELFGNGITESATAAALKRAAVRAKATKGHTELKTCAEWFKETFPTRK